MFLKQHYGPAEGPLGFPMTDRAAAALDAVLRDLPKSDEFAYRKRVVDKAAAELLVGERADVSWITTEAPDWAREVVVARGMNDGQFKLNPIVTLQHAYHLPPVGRSLWRKVVPGGVKAKTHYPPRPDVWPAGDWPADVAFALVQAELLRGKSIGFLPTKVHTPTADERRRSGWADVELVIDEWTLLEYACCYLPCQPEAVVESVSKSVPIPEAFADVLGLRAPLVPFTPLEEVEFAFVHAVERIDLPDLLHRAFDRAIGRI